MSIEDISRFFNESLNSVRKIKLNAIRKWRKDNKVLKSLDKYLFEVKELGFKIDINELELVRKVKISDVESLKKIFKDYHFLILLIIKKHYKNELSITELINSGNQGLITAAQYFNEKNGHTFFSYAIWWIRKMIIDSIDETNIILDLSNRKKNRKVKKINFSNFEDFSSVEMTIEETLRLRADERRSKLKEFNYKFHNNPSRIEELEKEPAYKRLGLDLSEKPISNVSRISLGVDSNDDIQLRSNNSFLHDNVD